MSIILYVVAYAAIAVFLGAVLLRVVFWTKMPAHVRWELYPVAHEGKKASYGGSYLEESEWWTKKRHVSLLAEAKAMFIEIVFLAALWEHNRKMWFRSFPFHFGLYLIIAATGVMVFASFLALLWPAAIASWFGGMLQVVTIVVGVGGMILSLFGALGLLIRRLTDEELKDYTAPSDIFNLLFFVGAFGLAFITWIVMDHDFSLVSYFVFNLVSFKMAAMPLQGAEAFLLGITVMSLSALLVYIPMTHMSHFVGKYFAYHSIRWNDTPNLKNGKEEDEIEGLLSLPVSWSAEHIGGDGKKSWAEVATQEVDK